MIRFESVTKRYGDGTVAVDDLDLVAPSHQITVLVGPSGCGKTTSLRMVNRMIEPTEGRIWLDARDTASVPPAELRRGMGYVIQHAGLFPHRTIVDNVATVPYLLGQDKRTARGRAMELLEQVGLPASFAKRYPAQLSGGQQQRVGVARALAADPPVMLMDEPFSAVDPVVRTQLQDEFLHLQRDLAKTILFVTHDIDEAIKLGDQVAVLRVGGTLAQLAPPSELLSQPADSFVAGFVGRDRGYRALGFTVAGHLPLETEQAVRLGADLHAARDAARDGWALVVDDENRPQGWLALTGVPEDRLRGTVDEQLLNLGGTLATDGGTLREALDAALSSPSGRGVIVDDAGHLLGTVSPSQVLARIEERASASRDATAELARGALMGGVWSYFRDNQSEVLSWLWNNTWLAALPLLVGLIIAMPLGYLASRYSWTYPPTVTAAGLLYTIPSLALFILLPGILRTRILDPINVAAALTIYTVALLVRVVADALNSVPAETRAAATAMGFTRGQRLRSVDLPLAVPVIAAGLRVAAVSNVSLVSVAAILGVPQLGQLFTAGYQTFSFAPVVLGLILAVLLALVFDSVILFGARLLTPWQRATRAR